MSLGGRRLQFTQNADTPTNIPVIPLPIIPRIPKKAVDTLKIKDLSPLEIKVFEGSTKPITPNI